jgi:hypothetical protein
LSGLIGSGLVVSTSSTQIIANTSTVTMT